MEFVEEVVKEVKWQLSLANKMIIVNSKDENEIRNTFHQMIGRMPQFTKLERENNDRNEQNDNAAPIMLQFENAKDKKQIMDKKGTFFKGKQDSIGLFHARTYNQRKMDQKKKETRMRTNNRNNNGGWQQV